jgi:hypothetical protein
MPLKLTAKYNIFIYFLPNFQLVLSMHNTHLSRSSRDIIDTNIFGKTLQGIDTSATNRCNRLYHDSDFALLDGIALHNKARFTVLHWSIDIINAVKHLVLDKLRVICFCSITDSWLW